jgi:thioredoxin 1
MIVTDKSFDEVISANSLILIDFWAEWCGPCKMVSPILDEISNETGLLVGKLNVDENPKKTIEYKVSSIPTMVLFKDGHPVYTVIGAKPRHAMMKELEEWL